MFNDPFISEFKTNPEEVLNKPLLILFPDDLNSSSLT